MQQRRTLEYIKNYEATFEWISIIWVCPTLHSSKCGHTNHLVSVSFIVGTESEGGKVPVGNAQPSGKLPPARLLHVDSGCKKAGSREFRAGSTILYVGSMSPLWLPRLLRGWRLKKCDQGAESTIYITLEPTERRTQNIKDTERVKRSPVTMTTPTFHRLRHWESKRKANVQFCLCPASPKNGCFQQSVQKPEKRLIWLTVERSWTGKSVKNGSCLLQQDVDSFQQTASGAKDQEEIQFWILTNVF